MKKIFTLFSGAMMLLALSSCKGDFLNPTSPSIVDQEFIFTSAQRTRSVMDGIYDKFRDQAQYQFYGDGLYYAVDIAGSDIERHPEPFSKQPGRHWVETLQQNGTHASDYVLTSYSKVPSTYSGIYNIASRCNAIISAMEASEGFEAMMSGQPSQLSQLYGEAVAMRATVYHIAIQYFGDVPYAAKAGEAGVGLAPRDSVYDKLLEDLIRVEPVMFDLGSCPDFPTTNKNYMSRTYVDALIGRIALHAAGYQTRRNDIKYVDGDGNALSFDKIGSENNDAFYGRRSDWKDLYQIAKKYYEICLQHLGTAVFHDTDPRAAEFDGKRIYNNPYQLFFQQMHDADDAYADESIYEYPMQIGTQDDARAYSMGRVSDGGERNFFPCKNYGQCRANPAYYFGYYDPEDMRRDVTWCVTGSNGDGTEKLIPFPPSSKASGGGITLNKWDENRQPNPWTAQQRRAGINGPYMRISEVYLSYAEVCAVLGEDGAARQYLDKVRNRAFPAGKANTDAFIAQCGGLFNAIIEERGFEFAGDGDRRWTLLRTGLFPEAIRKFKELTDKMLTGLEKDGYYTFENGNQISAYVWTKMVDAKSEYGYRLTTQTPAGKEDDPVLYPGWRGQHDSWESFGLDYKTDKPKTNLAIKGLFKYIDPDGPEAAALEADGYKKVDYASPKQLERFEYHTSNFYDYDYNKAPIYMFPFTEQILQAGGFTNGYGYRQTN